VLVLDQKNKWGSPRQIMKSGKMLCRAVVCVLAVLITGSGAVWAQKAAVPSRIVETVDDTQTVRLHGNVHPMTRAAVDQGALADSQPMTRMMLLLQRSAGQEQSLRQLLDAQQTKGSGSYHGWLTPAQFGTQYGPSDADVQAVTDWLTRQGFQGLKVAAGRTVIEFSGNAGQVRNAFHTEIHRYMVNGESHFANASDPAIPEALTPVVAGVVALHNFPKVAHVRNLGVYRRNKETRALSPLFTYGTPTPVNIALGPADWATIYNIPLGADGTGQSIAIVGQSNINVTDIENFQTMFGLPVKDPQVIVNGPDPGIVGPNSFDDEGEADLDVEWAGAIAPKAQIILVVSEGTLSNATQVSAGIDLSAVYIVDNNVAPVMSESYGSCEAFNLTAGNQFYSQLWEQAAAEGITVAVSSGDNGSAGCDPNPQVTPDAASGGLAVNGIASTPFNVAVGGTDFDPTAVPVTPPNQYWDTANTHNPNSGQNGQDGSAIIYSPEITWDDSACAFNYPNPATCASVDTSPNALDISAASGGTSNCIQATEDSSGNITCATNGTFPNGIGYAKPSWQQSSITPADSARDLPDVSFFASNGENGVSVVVCQSDVNPNSASCNLNSPYADFNLVGGTSAATPAFAAVMALVNQATGQRQGNANYVLYGLAANTTYTSGGCASSIGQTPATTCVYNDVTKGNNSVACVGGSPNCSANSSSPFGVIVSGVAVDNGNPAFKAGLGYDLATGLGSINVAHLLTSWGTVARTATTTTLTSPSGGATSGAAFTATVNVTGGATGDVSLIALSSNSSTAVLGSFGPFALTAGTATVTTTLLPVGTTYVAATYGGDATHAVSTSTPVALAGAVAGAGQASKTTLGLSSENANLTWTTPTTSSQNFVYGTPVGYILSIAVTNANGNSCSFSFPKTTPATAIPCPSGTVTLTDNGQPLTDFLNKGAATNVTTLNNNGLAEDQPINVNVGSHSIVAAYAGDSNYSASTSNTLSMTVTQATPVGVDVFSSLSSITSGTSVTFTAFVVTNSSGNGPTGMMAFTNGSTSIGSANCVPTSGPADSSPPEADIAQGTAYCTATLTTSISALYPPPGNGPRTPGIPVAPIILALISMVLFALGWKWMPQPRRRAYAYAGLVAFALLAAGIAGCGGGSGNSGSGAGTRTITAAYPGDVNYKAASGKVSITVQ
jgi:hypothetical protein